MKSKKVAIIGSGPSSLGSMDGIIDSLEEALREGKITTDEIREWKVDIFERSANVGYGGPYDPAMTGVEHLFNGRNVSAFHIGGKEVFFNWLQEPANQEKIDHKFREIFCSRFEEKFKLFFPSENYNPEAFNGKNIFSEGFKEESEYLRLCEALGEKFENLCTHYSKDYDDIKSRYLRFASKSEFPPRVAYGIYLNCLFEERLQRLGLIIGEENIVVHACTNVVGLDRDSNLLFRKTDAPDAQEPEGKKFDIVSAGTGRWQPDLEQTETDRYIANAWPISRVEQQIADLIKRAKDEGKSKVKFAIEGSSLTAVDMSKTILHNCGMGRFEENGDKLRFLKNEDLGIDVEVDMVSRNGMMSLVRGSFSWMPEQLGRYYIDAIKKVAQDKGIDFSEFDEVKFSPENNQVQRSQIRQMNFKLLEEYAKQNGGQIRLWQIFDSLLEICGAAYEEVEKIHRGGDRNEKAEILKQKADTMKDFATFVRKNRENYSEIIDLYSKQRASDAFRSLQADLDDVMIGDIGGDSVFEAVNKHFVGSVYERFIDSVADSDALKLLPEERMLCKKYESVYMCFDAPMPPESAKEMIALHEAGVLNSIAIGYDVRREESEAAIGWGDGN
jgi:hypothetical protein